MIKKLLYHAEELSPHSLKKIDRWNASGYIFFLKFAGFFSLWAASSAAATFFLFKTFFHSHYLFLFLIVITHSVLFALFLYYALDVIKDIIKHNIELKLLSSDVENSIRKTEKNFNTFLANINEYVYSITIHNSRPQASFHSPKCLDITGYPPDKLSDDLNLWQKIVHPLDIEKVQNHFRKVLSRENPPPIEHRIITKKGRLKWINNYCRAGIDHYGNIVRLDGYIFDITERKKNEEELKEYKEHLEELVKQRTMELAAVNRSLKDEIRERLSVEQELKQSEAKMRALIEASRDAMFLETLSGEILDCNPAATELYGYSREEFLNLSVKDLLPEGIDIDIDRVIRIQLEKGGFSAVLNNKKKDGTVFPCEINTKLINLEGNRVVAAYIKDISSRQQAENEIHNLNHQLRQHILELESLNKELKAFNHTVSHDLKSPLITINGYTNMVLKKFSRELDPEVIRLLNIIRLNAIKGEHLIMDLLALSYTEVKDVEKTPIDITELSSDIFEELIENYPDRSINLKFESPPFIEADPNLIQHVLTNFISNAIKFTERKKNTAIEIGGWLSDTHSVVYIKDNGIGFDMKNSEKLFDPFFRLHSKDEFEGTGVGLSIVKRIILKHGGDVWVKSKPGKGTTFYFSLPRVQKNELTDTESSDEQ